MGRTNQTQIKKDISQYLSSEEHLISIGVFKKVPSTGSLMLTRGMTWLLSQRFYVGVTDQRLIILPDLRKKNQEGMGENVIYAAFDEVEFFTGAFNTTILDVQKHFEGTPLILRFKPGYQIQGMDQFDFIAAVKQGKNSHVECVTA